MAEDKAYSFDSFDKVYSRRRLGQIPSPVATKTDVLPPAASAPPSESGQTCYLCSAPIAQHISQNQSYWYCPSCRQKLPNQLIQAIDQDHQNREAILRQFTNHSSHVQILRFQDPETGFHEHVVFPGQRLLLSLRDLTLVKIYSSEQVTTLAIDTIQARNLPPAPEMTGLS